MSSSINSMNYTGRGWRWLMRYLLPAMLIVLYLTEAYSKIQELRTLQYSDFSRYAKLFVLLPFLFLMLKTARRKFLLFVAIPVIIFALGQLSLSCGFGNNAILNLGRYLFPLIVLGAFTGDIRTKIDLNLLFTTFEWLMVFNTVCIFLGFLFGIEIFETYNLRRFGYNGLLMTSSASTYIYTLSLFYFLLKYGKEAHKQWKFVFMVVGSILVGTKSLYLVLFVALAYLLWRLIEGRWRFVVVPSFVLVSVAAGIYVFYSYDIFNDMIRESGIWSAVLSGRDELLVQNTVPFIRENWSAANYLFGGVCDFNTRSQMGFVDLFYFWGILGGLWYIFSFYRSFVIFRFTLILSILAILMLVIVVMAGNFFIYTSLPLFLLIFRERVLKHQAGESA